MRFYITLMLLTASTTMCFAASDINEKCHVDNYTMYSNGLGDRSARVKICCIKNDIIENRQIVATGDDNMSYRGLKGAFGNRIEENYCSEGIVQFGRIKYPLNNIIILKSLFW